MSLVLRHFARHSGKAMPAQAHQPLPAIGIALLVGLGVVGGLAALGFVMRLYPLG